MVFTSPLFLFFFVGFFALYIAAGGHRRWQLRLITAGSLVFYASFDWRFVPLLVGTSLLDFVCAQHIERDRTAGRTGTRWLVVTITCNLLVLGFFKYVNFLLDGVESVGTWMGAPVGDLHLDVILPLGISFYTFQSLSYTIDVYMQATHARRDPTQFLAGLTFFPHLLSGPIVRGQKLVSMFEYGPVITRERLNTGILLIGLGLFKKTVADLIAPIAGACFDQAAESPGDLLNAWTGVLAFAAQIYGDFAGYTDIAIGLALLLGYDFPQNFDLPYLAVSPADYWRRWHISLSTWLRDYLFMPLARARLSLFTCFMVTMGLAGVWHGAGTQFAMFGLYHGALLYLTEVVERAWGERLEGRWFARVAGTVITFNCTLVGYVMFRSASMSDAMSLTGDLYGGSLPAITWDGLTGLLLAVVALIVGHLVDWFYLNRRSTLLRPYVLVPLLFVCFAFAFSLGSETLFLYFQF